MVIYFSATGNSALVAKRIASIIEDDCINLLPSLRRANGDVAMFQTNDDILDLELNRKTVTTDSFTSEKPWVLVVPTYAFQLPRIIADFLRKTPLQGSKELYVVMTCGGSTAGSAAHLQDFCAEIGMEFKGLGVVVMPENYIAMFPIPSEEQSIEIVRNAPSKIDAIAADILSSKALTDGSTSAFSKTISTLLYNGFSTFAMKDKKFMVNPERCIRCRKCERGCPLRNITISDFQQPIWQGNCTHCMSCISNCPTKAIEYGKVTKNKLRYQCPTL